MVCFLGMCVWLFVWLLVCWFVWLVLCLFHLLIACLNSCSMDCFWLLHHLIDRLLECWPSIIDHRSSIIGHRSSTKGRNAGSHTQVDARNAIIRIAPSPGQADDSANTHFFNGNQWKRKNVDFSLEKCVSGAPRPPQDHPRPRQEHSLKKFKKPLEKCVSGAARGAKRGYAKHWSEKVPFC